MMPMVTGIWCVRVWWIKKKQKIKDKRSKIKKPVLLNDNAGFLF